MTNEYAKGQVPLAKIQIRMIIKTHKGKAVAKGTKAQSSSCYGPQLHQSMTIEQK